MKITSLELVNFRNHKHTVLELGPINLFGGLNGAGKSSLLYAIEMALTGICETTDRAGKGAADLVRVGEKQGMVKLDSEHHRVERTIPSGLQVTYRAGSKWVPMTGGIRDQQKALLELINGEAGKPMDERVIHAALNARDITDMAAADIKTLVFDLLGIQMDDLEALIEGWICQGKEANEVTQVAMTILPQLLDQSEGIDALYKAAFERRKDAKKELARLETELAAVVMPDGVNPGSLAEGEALLAKLRAEKEQLIARRAAAEASQAEFGRVEAEVNEVSAQLEQQTIADTAEQPPEPISEDDYEALSEDLKRAKEDIHPLRLESAELVGKLRTLEPAIAALKDAGDKCPLAPEVVKCAMTAADRKKLAADLKQQQKEGAARHTELQQEILDAERMASELERRVSEAAATRTAYENAKDERRDRDKQRANLNDRLTKLTVRQQELASQTASPDDVNSELQLIEARIVKGEMIVRELQTAAGAAEAKAKLTEDRDQAAASVAALELLVEALGPKGIRADLLGEKIGGLEGRINESLTALTEGEYQVSLEMEPDFHVLVSHGGVTTELKQLSTSERIRVGLAITEALVNLSGLGVLVLDDLEVLDIPNRGKLMAYLIGLQDSYDTVICLTTTERERLRPVPPVVGFWVEAGSVEEVVPAAVSA